MNEFLTAYGMTRTIDDWLADRRLCAVSREALRLRLKRGWPPESALSRRPHQKPKITPRPSPYRGVSFHRGKGRWASRIWHEEKNVTIGYFVDEVAAAKAYDRAARRLKGTEAIVNFSE